MEEGICENTVIHEDTVKNVKEKMPEDFVYTLEVPGPLY